MGQFSYLGYIIPVMIGEVLVAVYAIYKLATKCSPGEMPEEQINAQNMAFQNTYSCCISVRSNVAAACLGTYRALCFCYFMGIGVLWNLIRDRGWQYFTNWNLILISMYYFLAFCCSLIGMLYGYGAAEWSQRVRRLGYSVHILFEVVGGTALLVTVVDFTLLNPEFSFWNASEHFATLMSLLVELCVNSLPIRLDHYGYNALWASAYLIFIWPVVTSGARKHWPYDFLSVDSASCFVWYTGLLIADIFFYCLWVGLGRLKVLAFLRIFRMGPDKIHHDLITSKDVCIDNALLADGERIISLGLAVCVNHFCRFLSGFKKPTLDCNCKPLDYVKFK